MNNEVKRYDLVWTPTGRAGIEPKGDGRFILLRDHEETTKQLRALEDALARLSDLDQKSEELEESIQATLRNAVANSRARKQG